MAYLDHPGKFSWCIGLFRGNAPELCGSFVDVPEFPYSSGEIPLGIIMEMVFPR
jgi:hypothetical protein